MKPLWAHQQAFVDLAERLPSAGALMRPGSGKTRAVVEALRREYNRQGRLVNTLVFAPPLPCEGWKKEFLANTKLSDEQVLVLNKAGPKRVKDLVAFLVSKKPAVVATNYEAVQIEKFYRGLTEFSPEIVVLDESHRVKDSGGVRAKKIYDLTDVARRKFIMTGTLTPNSLLDVYGQFRAMNAALLGPSFWQFRARYFYDKNAGMPAHVHFPDWQPRPECAEWLGKLIAENCVQAGEAEDLPELQEIVLPVELGRDQRKAYDGMVKEFVAECGTQFATASFAMTKTVRLRQILCGFLQPDNGDTPVWFEDVPRLNALADLLDSLRGEQILLWTEFRPTYEKLREVCKRVGFRVGSLTGEESIGQKNEVVALFNKSEIDLIIGHPAAAAEGVNLQAARYAVYYARSFNALHFDQSRARNYRGGSGCHASIVHYHLRTNDTLDEVIHEALVSKREISRSVLAWAQKEY